MNLIKISKDILVNPQWISSIEKRSTKVIVWVDGRAYDIDEVSEIEAFLKEISTLQNNLWGQQHFRG